MKIIYVEFKKIRVTDISIREGVISLEIIYANEKDKEISRETRIEDPRKEAEKIFNELKKMETSVHQEFNGEKFLDNYVNIVIKEEDAVMDKLTDFLRTAKDKITEIKSLKDSTGFIDKINALKLMKLEF